MHNGSTGTNPSICCRKYEFALEEVEGFRYRSRDAWRAVTRVAVREARLKEIKQELLNCKKLQVRCTLSIVCGLTNSGRSSVEFPLRSRASSRWFLQIMINV